MKGRTYTIRTGGRATEVTALDKPPTLAEMQEAVGGYIESVPQFTEFWADEDKKYVSCIAYCNEGGKLNNLPHNSRATIAWDASMRRMLDHEGERVYPRGLLGKDGAPVDTLCGTVIVVVGDEEFMQAHILDPDEDEEPDPEWWMTGEFIPACEEDAK